jgi:sortilin-related receptor
MTQSNATHQYQSTERQFMLPANHSGEMYYASVNILDSHGYQSPRSEPLDMLFMFADEIKPSASTESPHVYVAVAVAVVVVLALAASLVILLIRHRRLQRSFVNFVNPHYDTRSGAATFTDQTLGEIFYPSNNNIISNSILLTICLFSSNRRGRFARDPRVLR